MPKEYVPSRDFDNKAARAEVAGASTRTLVVGLVLVVLHAASLAVALSFF